MEQPNKVLRICLIVSGIYFLLSIFPNLTGAKEPAMLAVFEVDEYAQYPHVVRMLTLGDTLYQTVRNFSVYLHYFYGYPFYFISAIFLLPVRLIFGQDWVSHTPWIMLVLRQFISVLPTILSAMLLVHIHTRFRSLWRSLSLLLLLLFIPAVVVNDLWWHPDALSLLFNTLAVFFFARDEFRFGRNFLFAALAVGLSIGTKLQGLFFFLPVLVYLAWGVFARKIAWKRGIYLGLLFTLVLVGTIIISNPLLLLPIERGEIFNRQQIQLENVLQGFLYSYSESFFARGYPQDFRIHYGELLFFLLGIFSLIVGVMRRKSRLVNLIILTFIIPFAISILIAQTRRTLYFLPVMFPLISCIANLFTGESFFPFTLLPDSKVKALLPKVISWLLGAAVLFQMGVFLYTNVGIYSSYIRREETSQSIAFYRKLEREVLPMLQEQNFVVYRDWHVYFPEGERHRVEMSWEPASYAYIQELSPDLIVLERENIKTFSRQDLIEVAVEPGEMALVFAFYRDASINKLAGYQLVAESDFGYAFLNEELYRQYFPTD